MPLNNTKRQSGFTLIEMIITIVIVGILGVGIANFVGRSVQGMADTAERQQLATIGWVVSEKISRELRNALPNSIRTGAAGTCIEFVPIIAGSDYLTVPTLAGANSFEAVPFPNYLAANVNAAQDRIAVYPSTLTGLYGLPDPGIISGTLDQLSAGVTANAITVELAANHQFITDSPTRRFFVVQDPVMYCFSAGSLYRYDTYGFSASFSTASLSNETVIGNRLASGTFSYSPGTLARSGIVSISFSVQGDNGATQSVDQEVQVRNVP